MQMTTATEQGVTRSADDANRWLGIAVASLVCAGLLSLALLIGRAPGLYDSVASPLFFKRALTVHVVLALVVWFGAYGCSRVTRLAARWPRVRAQMPWLAVFSMVLMLISAFIPTASPVLANYIPIVDHPVFIAGLVVFATSVVGTLASSQWFADTTGVSTLEALFLRGWALCVAIAVTSLFAGFLNTPRDLPSQSYYELVVWGGGHVLQTASLCLMLANWIALVGAPTKGATLLRAAAIMLVAPWLAMPLLAFGGTNEQAYYEGATFLMRWTSWPPTLLALFVLFTHAHKAPNSTAPKASFERYSFYVSVLLCLLGFALGASIRGADTRVPAHYHAAIGAVTASCMAVTLAAVRDRSFLSQTWKSLLRWQPVAFGIGQSVFAFGFAFAGIHGSGRKTYGSEQHLRTASEWIGLGVMCIGGLVAVVAGIVFLAAMIRYLHRSATSQQEPRRQERELKWSIANTPSKS